MSCFLCRGTDERLERIERLLEQLLQQGRVTNQEIVAMTDTLNDVDAGIATLEADVPTLQAAVQSVITKLSQTPVGAPAPDFTAEVTRLTALHTALGALTATTNTAGQPPATTGGTPPAAA